MRQLQLCQILILPLASGHGAGRLPGDSTLCTSYSAPTRKSHPKLPTLEVAEREPIRMTGRRVFLVSGGFGSPHCSQCCLQPSPLSGPTKCPEVP